MSIKSMNRANDGMDGGSAMAKNIKTAIIIVIALLVLYGVGFALDKYTNIPLPFISEEHSQASDWQAVFLSNGQVYFGKVVDKSNDSIILNNIYYLQVVTKPLQRTAEGDTAAAEGQQELTLIKLGNELHGPTDRMVINRDHVLLTEVLRNDSRVVQAIDQYLKDQQNPPAANTGTAPAPTLVQ
jgi:hypothetical protein